MYEKLINYVSRNANYMDCDAMGEVICRYKETNPTLDELIEFYCDLYEIFVELYIKEEDEDRLKQLGSCTYTLKSFIVSTLLEKRQQA